MKWWGALLDHEIHWYLLNTYRWGNLCPSFCLSTTLQTVVYCTSRKQQSHSLWTLGLTDFCGSPPHQCVVNIIIILNPKHSTELATKKRINSIPDEIRTTCIVATFYLSQLQLKKKIPSGSCSTRSEKLLQEKELHQKKFLLHSAYSLQFQYRHFIVNIDKRERETKKQN